MASSEPPDAGPDVSPGERDALAAALSAASSEPGHDPSGGLTLDQLAAETGVSPTLLEAVVRTGLLVPADSGGPAPFARADVDAVRAGMSLLEAGVPLSELLALAREHDEATRATAERAVELFARYVRDPLRATAGTEAEVAAGMVAAVEAMLPAAGTVVGHHFRQTLLSAARQRVRTPPPAGASGGGADPEPA